MGDPSLLQWVAAHGVAVTACHPLNVYRARALVWSQSVSLSSSSSSRHHKECFIEQHGLGVFYRSLPSQLLAALASVLLLVPLANVWRIVASSSSSSSSSLSLSAVPLLLAALLAGALRAPAEHALLVAQHPASSSSSQSHWFALSSSFVAMLAARDAVLWSVYALFRAALFSAISFSPSVSTSFFSSSSVVVAALPSLFALLFALVLLSPFDLLLARLVRHGGGVVVSLDALLEQAEPRGLLQTHVTAALIPRLLHGLLLFLVTCGWGYFLAFVYP